MTTKKPRKTTLVEYPSTDEFLHKLIKTPQEFIHLNHDITLKQYIIWLLALKACHIALQSGKEIPHNQWFYFSTSEIHTLLGYRSKRNELSEEFETLRKKPITYNVLRKDSKEIKFGSGFISQWSIDTDGQVGIVLPDFIVLGMKSLELRSAIFQDLNLLVFSSFDSQYHAYHYKLFKDYEGIGRTPNMPLHVYKSYMGIADGEYTEFKELNKKIIKPSLDGVANSISDVYAEPVYSRNRDTRMVESLYFKIIKKDAASSSSDVYFGEAAQFLSPTVQASLLAAFTPEQIAASVRRATEYIQEQASLHKAVKSRSAIYLSAIKGNWGEDIMVDSSPPQLDYSQPVPSPAPPPQNPAQSDIAPDLMARQAFRRSLQTDKFRSMLPADFAKYVAEYALSKGMEPYSMLLDPKTGLPLDKITSFSFDTWLRTHPDFDITADESAFLQWHKKAS